MQERKNLVTSGRENQRKFCLSILVGQRLAGNPDAFQWGACTGPTACYSSPEVQQRDGISGGARDIWGGVEMWGFGVEAGGSHCSNVQPHVAQKRKPFFLLNPPQKC